VASMPKEAKDAITEALGRYLYPESEWDIVAE
jgi:hypothetical protein